MILDKYQTANLQEMLLAVQERARNQGWGKIRARRMARMVIQCGLTESSLHNYSSVRIPESKQYGDPGWIGGDHYSVGVMQQQPIPFLNGGGWGSVKDCMTPKLATHLFMARATDIGSDSFTVRPALAIQHVQVSAFADGSNYKINRAQAVEIVRKFWDTSSKKVIPINKNGA